MPTIQPYLQAWAEALPYALCCSLAQGLGVFSLLWMLFRAFPAMRTSYKYVVACLCCLLLFGWFVATLAGRLAVAFPVADYSSGAFSKIIISGAVPQYHTQASYYTVGGLHLPAMPWVLPVYGLGLVLMSLRFLAHLAAIGRLRTRGLSLPTLEWTGKLKTLAGSMKVSARVRLFCSSRISAPLMLGALKPIILLPVTTLTHLTPQQVEAIILHELAHIRRHDYLVNMLQVVVETLMFFNPFLWLISAQVRTLREECCDELVVAHAASPLPYAQALALLETHRANPLSLAAAGPKKQLFNRIKKIIEMNHQNPVQSALPALATILLLTMVIGIATFTPSLAQKSRKAQSAHTPTNTDTDTTSGGGQSVQTPARRGPSVTVNNSPDPKASSTGKYNTVDSPVIQLMLHDSTVIWARLAPNPYEASNVIGVSSIITTGGARPDWDEMNDKMVEAIDRAYHHPGSAAVSDKIRRNVAHIVASDQKSLENVYFRDEQNHTVNGIPVKKEHHEYAGTEAENQMDAQDADAQNKYIDAQVRKAEADNRKALADNQVALANHALALANAEKARKDFERARPELERIRKEAEAARQELEKQRPQLEKARLEAEKARIVAELARLEAEKKRLEADRLALESKAWDKEGDTELRTKMKQRIADGDPRRTSPTDFIDLMEKDGLIQHGAPYHIIINRRHELYINGVKQPGKVAAKYTQFLQENTTLEATSDGKDEQ